MQNNNTQNTYLLNDRVPAVNCLGTGTSTRTTVCRLLNQIIPQGSDTPFEIENSRLFSVLKLVAVFMKERRCDISQQVCSKIV